MTKAALPTEDNWNHYWHLDQTQKFTKASWSKRRIMAILDRYVKGGVALDAGCGSGFFSKYFCDRGMETVSLDYSQEALKIAGRLTEGRSQLIPCDLVKDSLQNSLNKKCQVIFTDGLFEHFSLEDQDRIFKNLQSVLADNGVIITFVPNQWSPWEFIRPLYMPGIEEKPFTLHQLVQLNERNDASVLERGGINTVPFALSPDRWLGSYVGMLLYTVARNDE